MSEKEAKPKPLCATQTEQCLLEAFLRAVRKAKRDRRQLTIMVDWWLSGGDGLYLNIEQNGPCTQHEICNGEMVSR